MPTRWFVPVPGIDPDRVRLEHVHAGFTRWFDRCEAEHAANDKPYTISPLTERGGVTGVEIATLTGEAARRVADAGQAAVAVRLGNQTRRVGKPIRLREVTWTQLAQPTAERRWTLSFLTPTTFRTGDRSSPLPTVGTIMGGLSRAWSLWCDEVRVPERGPSLAEGLWVSDLDLASHRLDLGIPRRGTGEVRRIRVCGVTGSLTLRAQDDRVAAWAGPLLRLAPFCGVGSMRAKGLGVVQLTAQQPVGRRDVA